MSGRGDAVPFRLIQTNGFTMLDASTIFYLAMFTLGSALAFGAWQLRRVKQAQKNDEHSSLARRR